MNGYERIMAVFKGEIPDCVPLWELGISQDVIDELYRGENLSLAEFVERMGYDGITVREEMKLTYIDSSTFYDEWGIVRRIGERGTHYYVEGPIKDEADLDKYSPPDPYATHRFATLREVVDKYKYKKAIILLSHDAFEFSYYLCGMENLFMFYVTNPEFVHRLARKVIEYKKAVIERAIKEGVDIILSGDDYAYHQGLMMSKAHFKEYVLPYLKEIVELTKKHGKYFIKHCDGNIWSIIDDFIDIGVDGLHPLEPIAGMDIGEVKERYGDRLVLIGNVDCSSLLTWGSEEEVCEATKETIAKAAPNGRYILSSSNSIHSSVKAKNLLALIQTARKFGRYPLDEKFVEEYRNKNYILKYLQH
jgi:uroporphyrinogen decarboxylase